MIIYAVLAYDIRRSRVTMLRVVVAVDVFLYISYCTLNDASVIFENSWNLCDVKRYTKFVSVKGAKDVTPASSSWAQMRQALNASPERSTLRFMSRRRRGMA
jgi:hypothetical protein